VSVVDPRTCEKCGGTGWTVAVREGREVVVRCACRSREGRARLLAGSRIPERYLHCTIDGFEIWPDEPGERSSLQRARHRTREFVDLFPAVEKGLLFQGRPGTGKTHLAVAALRELVETKRVRGLYANAIDLVQELQMTFNGGGRGREAILQPVVDAELLVLDELGTGKMSPWVQDLLYYVVNSRYMTRRTTLFTSNYFDHPGSDGTDQLRTQEFTDSAMVKSMIGTGSDRTNQLRTQESLADRISGALRSRLYEMCELIDIRCTRDYREHSAMRRLRL
jgi:DNA replication protein DnaC